MSGRIVNYFDESTESPTKNWQRELGKTAWVRVLFTDTKKEEFVPRGNIITTHSTDLSDVQLKADKKHWRGKCDKDKKIKFDVQVWDGSHGHKGSVPGQICTFHVIAGPMLVKGRGQFGTGRDHWISL